ncbi:hypothetical protein [Sulfurimonas sp. C5]|nr:hypothetical protein [Sulfurimonas sp. C5]MDH4944838.1 hypothetical protein [Sulfurimonas sp. C5]
MPRKREWTICENSAKAGIGKKKNKPKKSSWSVCDSDQKWFIGKKKS